MSRRNRPLSAVCFTAALSTVACGGAPSNGIDAAKSAMEAARSVGAETYAIEAFTDAEKSLAEAVAEVEAQGQRIVLFRSYTEASRLLREAKDRAEEARKQAEIKRQEWKDEAETLIQQTQAALVAARERVENAHEAARRKKLTTALQQASDLLFEAETLFKSGSYIEAHSKAEDAKTYADEVAEESGS